MVDFDVFPFAFGPATEIPAVGDIVFLHPRITPCAVQVAAKAREAIPDLIRACTGGDAIEVFGRPHFSDQEMFRKASPIPDLVNEVSSIAAYFGKDGWEKSRLVHFSNNSLAAKGDVPRLVSERFAAWPSDGMDRGAPASPGGALGP